MKKRKFSDQDLILAVKNCTSVRQVLKKINLVEAGGNYATVKKLIKNLNLDTSHFVTNRDANLGKRFGPKRPISDYLNNKISITSYKLKLRLIQENIFQHKCSNCKLQNWCGKLIPLELDHIDGNHANNNLSNLRLLCPNCHALTDNYRAKNISKK